MHSHSIHATYRLIGSDVASLPPEGFQSVEDQGFSECAEFTSVGVVKDKRPGSHSAVGMYIWISHISVGFGTGDGSWLEKVFSCFCMRLLSSIAEQ